MLHSNEILTVLFFDWTKLLLSSESFCIKPNIDVLPLSVHVSEFAFHTGTRWDSSPQKSPTSRVSNGICELGWSLTRIDRIRLPMHIVAI